MATKRDLAVSYLIAVGVGFFGQAAQQLDDFGRMTAIEPVNLSTMARERVEELRQTNPDATVAVDIEAGTFVRANELLSSVVENLLGNTVEHTSDDPTIEVRVHQEDDEGVLHIEDNGPGFSEAELELYEKGFETELLHSDGVGLWLANWIVDSYGGALSLENTETGARVCARLPAASSEPDHS